MSQMINATRLASRCAMVAKQLRGEADRWQGAKRADLIANSATVYAAIGATMRAPGQVEKVLSSAIDVLTLAASLRLERDAAAFLANPKGFAHE